MEFLADVDDELDYNEEDLPSLSGRADSGDREHGRAVAPLRSYHRSNSINQHGKPRDASSTSSCTSSSPLEEGEAYSDEDEQPQVPVTTADHPRRDPTAGRIASGRHQDEKVHDSNRRSSRKQHWQTRGDREEGEASSDDESIQQQQQSAKGFRKHDSSSSMVPPLLFGEEAEAQYKHRLQERYTQRFRGEEVSKKGDLSEKRRRRDAVEPVHGEREKESRRSVKQKRPADGKFIEPRSTFTIEPVEDRPSSKSGGRVRVEEQFDNQEQQISRRQHSRSSRTKQEHAATEFLDAYETSGRDPRHYDASPPFKSLPATSNDAISRSYSASYLPAQRNESDSQRNDYSDEVYYRNRDKRVEQVKVTSSDMQLDQQPDKGYQHRVKKSKRDRRSKDKDEKVERTTERDLRRILLAQQQQQQLKQNPSSTTQLDQYARLDSAQGYKKYRASSSSNPSKRRSPSPGSPRPSPSRSAVTSTSSSASSSPSHKSHRNRQTLAEHRQKEAYLGEDTDRYYHQQQPKQSRGGRGRSRDDELPAMDDGDVGDYTHKRARKHTTDSYRHKLAEPTDDRDVAEKRNKTSDEVDVRQKRRKTSSSPTDPVLELHDSQALGRSKQTHRSHYLKRSPFPAENQSSSASSSSGSADSEHARGNNSDQSDECYHQTMKMEEVEEKISSMDADSLVRSHPGSRDYATQEAVGNVDINAEKLKAEATVEETQRPRRPLSYTGPPAHLFSESESDEPSDSEMLTHGTVVDILLQRQHGTPPDGMTETDDRANPAASPSLPPQLAGARLYSSKPFYYPSIQGCRSVEEFECLNRIEEGTYGVVYRARDKKINEIVALKRLKMEKERDGFPITSLREINTLMKAQHENIVTVREIVVGSNMDKIYLVMDYVEHDLKSLMEIMNGPFSVGEVKCLLVQLLRAVRHLHDNWILHRDLKTSNLLLSHQGILKVGDFGLAREYGSPLKHYTEVVVTLWYRAPELLLGVKQYTCPIDLWSVGCIFAEFLLQRPLFPGKGEVDELNIIFRDLGTPTEKIWPGVGQLPGMKKCAFTEYPYNQLRRRFTEKQISDQGFDLLNSFLTYCPERRVTAEKALGHAYFTERPRAIHPSMFPSWPAKSEGGVAVRKASPRPQAGGGALAAAAAAASASVGSGAALEGGRVRYQPPAPPMGGQRFYSSMGDSLPGTAVASGGAGEPNASGAVDRGFFLRF